MDSHLRDAYRNDQHRVQARPCKGIKPKQHLSEPCPGAETVMEKRKHADRCVTLPPDLPEDMDLMIEVRTQL